jgi:hypothetical protein
MELLGYAPEFSVKNGLFKAAAWYHKIDYLFLRSAMPVDKIAELVNLTTSKPDPILVIVGLRCT